MSNLRELIEQLNAFRWIIFDNSSCSMIWLPKGLQAKHSFEQFIVSVFISASYEQVELPSLINPEIFLLQKDHADGLAPYIYRVFTTSSKQDFILRPTSEVPFTSLFKLLGADSPAPIKFVQSVSVYRDEIVSKCEPFMRMREINPFIETYTLSKNEEYNLYIFENEISIYEKIISALKIPFKRVLRPREDTFPEARATIAFDTTDEVLGIWQIASVHDLGESFATAQQYKVDGVIPSQTSTGISSRAMLLSLYYHWIEAGRDLRRIDPRNLFNIDVGEYAS